MYVCIKENALNIDNFNSFVPQHSVLAPPFFLEYINDICNAVEYSLYRVVNNLHDASLLQYELQAISEMAK